MPGTTRREGHRDSVVCLYCRKTLRNKQRIKCYEETKRRLKEERKRGGRAVFPSAVCPRRKGDA